MEKYICTNCGYVYDPIIGDPEEGILPGTSFDDIPNEWECLICGYEKSDFELFEEHINTYAMTV